MGGESYFEYMMPIDIHPCFPLIISRSLQAIGMDYFLYQVNKSTIILTLDCQGSLLTGSLYVQWSDSIYIKCHCFKFLEHTGTPLTLRTMISKYISFFLRDRLFFRRPRSVQHKVKTNIESIFRHCSCQLHHRTHFREQEKQMLHYIFIPTK